MLQTDPITPWYCCVDINDDSKAYFPRQLAGFAHVKPHVVAWSDTRAEKSVSGYTTVDSPFYPRFPIPGGYRLARVVERLSANFVENPLGTRGGELARLMDLTKEVPPDVIYAHSGFMALRILPLKKAQNVPMVVHFHGLEINTSDPLIQSLLRSEAHHFDRAIVVGDWMIDRVANLGVPEDKIHLVPMGCPLSDFHKTKSLPNSPTTFIFVGRLVPYKGLDLSIAAFAKAHDANPDLRFSIVGDGPVRHDVERQVKALGLSEKVTFHGHRSGEETLDLIANSHALVHHALDDRGGPEAFGVVVAEAMAQGKPVIASRCGGVSEQVLNGTTGFLVDQYDTDDMAKKMLAVADDPQLAKRLGNAGAIRARESFDAQVLARRAEDILIETVREHRSQFAQ